MCWKSPVLKQQSDPPDMIKEFQAKVGLDDDGLMGPNTAKALKNHLCIDTDEKAAHFLGQCHHESMGFTATVENLNYSQKALLATFRNYFTNNITRYPNKKLAKDYARKPQAIGSYVYANRMGNGDEASGDGYKHRGQGLIQVTGKNNQYLFAESINNLCIKDDPDIIGKEYPLESAVFYFNTNGLWKYCHSVNDDNILLLSKAINTGSAYSKITPHGLKERIFHTDRYYKWLKK